MRILLTTDTIGGVWTFNCELANELLIRGHTVVVVAVGPPPSPTQLSWCAEVARIFSDSFRFYEVDVSLEWMQSNEDSYIGAKNALLQLCNECSINIFHSSQYCFGCLPLDIPKVITAHSDVFGWAEVCRPQGLESSVWLEQYKDLVESGLKGADALIAPTSNALNGLGKYVSLPDHNSVIPNGYTSKLCLVAQERYLQAVSVGRLWDEAKNVKILTTIKSLLPIVIAGDCREDVSNYQTTSNITMLGQLDEKALLRLFRSSSIYIAPSLYEPFGLAPLEAASCGCALLLNDIPTFREIWGSSALYFENKASLESHLEHLVRDRSVLVEQQLKALRRAKQLTASHMASSYLGLYTKLLSQRAMRVTQELTAHAH